MTREAPCGSGDYFVDADSLDAFVVVRARIEKAGVALDVLHQHFMLRAMRPPHPRKFAPREKRDARRSHRGGKMLHAGVVADEHRAARTPLARIAYGGFARQARRVAPDSFRDPLAHRYVGAPTEHDDPIAPRSQTVPDFDETIDRPPIWLQLPPGRESNHQIGRSHSLIIEQIVHRPPIRVVELERKVVLVF